MIKNILNGKDARVRNVETWHAASLLARSIIVISITTLLLYSCNNKSGGKEPIASAGGKYLYKEDIENIFLAEMSKEDSAAAVEKHIRSWATDILMYEQAQKNIKNEEEIASLLENYRRTLLIYEYQLQLVKKRLNNSVAPEDMKSYYQNNPQLFRLNEVLIKGIFLKVSNQAPDIDALRSLVIYSRDKDLDQIESLSIKNAAKFEHFSEKWHPLQEIQRKSPIRVENKESLKHRPFHEGRDSLSTYFLFVREYKLEGEQEPLDYAESKIRGILLEQRKNDFLKQFSEKLYEEGVKKGKVTLYEQN
jgi:hypothetical protein